MRITEQDKNDVIQFVQHQRSESAAYWRQWVLWLSVGSAGAAIAFISLAAKLPDPTYAFQIFIPSLWSFLIGMITAAICLPFAALRAEKTGEHYAAAFNRDQHHNAARLMPEMISEPRSIAEQANAPRDEIIKLGDAAHSQAERAWRWRSWWRILILVLLSISAISFIFGVSWPLIYVSRGGSLISSHMSVQ